MRETKGIVVEAKVRKLRSDWTVEYEEPEE